MRVKILAGTLIRGVPADAGDIREVDVADYNVLKIYGLAEPYKEPEEGKVVNNLQSPEKSFKPKKGGRRKK